MELVSFSHHDDAVAEYGEGAASVGNLVMALKVKRQADGSPPEDPADELKTRICIADAKHNSLDLADTHSGCATGPADHVISQLAVELNALTAVCDVSCAYGKAREAVTQLGRDRVTGMVVGRNLYARVPSWLVRYGPYPALDARGRPNLLLIKWAMRGGTLVGDHV